jgi:hypothetical protein
MNETWGQFFRGNFDKLLLFFLLLIVLVLVLHMAHDKADASNIAWGREQAGTILGALLGLITGAALRRNDPPRPPGAVA